MNNTVSYDELINKMFSILDKEEEGSEFTSYTLFEKVSESDDYIKELINSETVDYMKLDSLLMQEAGEHGYFLDKCLRAGKYDGYVFAVKRRKYKRITGIEIKTHCIGFMNFEPDILYNTELNISENGSVQYK